ncbi:MAG: SGNH/GDSL hydrolase family protein, partial [Bacteroidota bacterium]
MKLKYLLHTALTVPLLPLMYLHGKRIMSTIPKLPEAQQPSGTILGTGAARKVLIIGESTMAGVGVATHEDGFAHAMAQELARQLDTTIHWKVYARSGYTLRRLHKKVLPRIEEESADLIVLGMGGNEAFK